MIRMLVTLFFSFAPLSVFAAAKLQVVENKKVCMVTDTVFEKPQIPVVHAGKTYYGCCQNCKKTLQEDAQVRAAVDPVSGKAVDKSSAVIAAKEDGSVVYFESKANLERYNKRSAE